jgi:hypothetical protein
VGKNKEGVYFVDGYAARSNLIGLVSYLYEFEDTDAEHARFYTYNLQTGRWGHLELDHEIVSVVQSVENGSNIWRAISKRGVVLTINKTAVDVYQIERAGTGPRSYGYLSQIRKINEKFYICGYRRQVYVLESNEWRHIDDEILESPDTNRWGFYSIDGTASTDIYAVGRKGQIFQYNGSRWTSIDSPTNSDLNRVKCVSPSSIYACGDSGVFLKGTPGAWEVVQSDNFKENLWGLEVFNGVPYVASLKGIRYFDGERLIQVRTGLKPEPGGYRLHATEGVLWSIGHDDVTYFDGKVWTRVMCPDNVT